MNKEKIIEAVDEAFEMYRDDYEGTSYFDEKEWAENKRDAIFLLKEQEAVVRCKDCRKNMMCEMTIHKPKDWFCADGERR